jgi:hypothetical protein
MERFLVGFVVAAVVAAVATWTVHWWRGRRGLDQWPDPHGRYYDEWLRLKGRHADYWGAVRAAAGECRDGFGSALKRGTRLRAAAGFRTGRAV